MRRLPLLLLAGCGSDPHVLVQPSHASMFGDVDVTITGDLVSAGSIREVTVGGVHALDVRPTASGLVVHLQGAPKSGPAEIRIDGDRGVIVDRTAFSFDASDVPVRWMAFGASLTHGAQSGGLDARGQLHGYAADVARAAGVFLAPPLVTPNLLPPLQPADFVADCHRRPDTGLLAAALFRCVTDPDTKAIDLRRARLDPTLETHDPAVGGAKLRDVISGMLGPGHVLEKVGELPDGDPQALWSPTTHPQLDRIKAIDPDIAISGDLLANDVMPAVTADDDIHPEAATDPATIASQLDTITSTIGALHGQYFIANLLDVTLLPSIRDLRARRIAAGQDTDATFDAKLAAVRAIVHAYSDALTKSASRYPNVHVLDLAGEVQKLLANGTDVARTHLTGEPFGGLLSLDHMHFSDTGYALMANFFIRQINGAIGTHVAEIDLEPVFRADPFSPDNLRAQGVRCGQ